jgi:hypothetical protein
MKVAIIPNPYIVAKEFTFSSLSMFISSPPPMFHHSILLLNILGFGIMKKKKRVV